MSFFKIGERCRVCVNISDDPVSQLQTLLLIILSIIEQRNTRKDV